MDKLLDYLIQEHRGKTAGAVLGLFVALAILLFGFKETLFVAVCVTGGFLIGKAIDEQVDFEYWLTRLFRRRS